MSHPFSPQMVTVHFRLVYICQIVVQVVFLIFLVLIPLRYIFENWRAEDMFLFLPD